MKIGSLFSGVGGLEKELIKFDNITLEYVAEPEKYCAAVLNKLHPDVPNLGSVTSIGDDVPYTDIILGGSECQGFSYQGARKGLKGERSKLFYNMLDIVKQVKPKYVVWENVAGAMTSNKKEDFKIIKYLFDEAGYEIDYEIFDASRYSPTIQQRRRIILLATIKTADKVELNRTVPTFELDAEMQDIQKRLVGASKSHREEHIDVRYNKGIANTLVTSWGCQGQSTANYIVEDDGIIRDLTINECETLMTWEKDYTKYGLEDGQIIEIPLSDRYRMCGQGVVSKFVPNVLKNLIENG